MSAADSGASRPGDASRWECLPGLWMPVTADMGCPGAKVSRPSGGCRPSELREQNLGWAELHVRVEMRRDGPGAGMGRIRPTGIDRAGPAGKSGSAVGLGPTMSAQAALFLPFCLLFYLFLCYFFPPTC